MPRYLWRTYACDSAGDAKEHTFTVMVEPDEVPKFCSVCGYPVGDVEAIPGTHSIGEATIVKAVDATYRALEESSAARAEAVGQPALKVTNMNDHLREGDVAYKMPRNSVTQWMSEAEKVGASYGFGGGSMTGFNPSVGPAPVPKTGWTGVAHPALAGIQGAGGMTHANNIVQAATAGQMNKGPAR